MTAQPLFAPSLNDSPGVAFLKALTCVPLIDPGSAIRTKENLERIAAFGNDEKQLEIIQDWLWTNVLPLLTPIQRRAQPFHFRCHYRALLKRWAQFFGSEYRKGYPHGFAANVSKSLRRGFRAPFSG
jgi:hypothetical protein